MLSRFGIPLLLAGVTLIFLPYFELPYETSKIVFFRVFLNVLIFIWGLIILTKKEISFPKIKKEFLWLLLIIVFANFFSFINSFDIRQSFFGSPYRYQGVYTLLHYAALFILVLSIFKKSCWKYFEWTFAGITSALFFISVWQFFITKDPYFYGRATGTLGNPVYMAQLLLLLLPILISAFFSKKQKLFWGTIAVFNIIAIFLTGSRGAFVGLLAGIIFYAISAAWKFRLKWLAWTCGIFVSCVFIFIIALNVFGNNPEIQKNTILRRLTFLQYDSVKPIQSRFDIWSGTSKLIADNPVFGVGQDVFDIAFEPYAPEPLKKHPTQYADRAHNLILDILATYGIFGFLSYLFFFITLLFFGCKYFKKETKKTSALAALGLMTGFISLITAMQFNFFVIVHHVFFWPLVAIYLVFISNKTRRFKLRISPAIQYILITVLTIITGANIFIFNLLPAIQAVFNNV